MLKKISKVILAIIIAGGIYTGTASAEGKSLGISAGIDYQSTYLWRGTYFYGKGVFFPKVSYDVMGSGLFLSVWAELADDYLFDGDKTHKDLQSTDFGIDYSKTFAEFITVGAGFWYFMLWETDYSFMYWYLSVGLALPLNPTITIYHDIYQKEQANDGQYSDIYIQLALSHAIELTKEASITPGAAIGYYRNKGFDRNGISDIDLKAELAVTKGMVTYTGGFHLIIVPTEDYYKVGTEDDIVRYYAKFGVSLSF